MSFVGDVIGDVVGGITGAKQQASAAQSAAETQAGMSQAAIDEQRRQFDTIVKMMEPYVSAGTGALSQQQGLLGLKGQQEQQLAINQLQQSPLFKSMMQQGQNAILQNASATGGLRGGNTQAALAQFAPNVLSNIYQQQLSQLGGLSSLGQASAGLQAGAGQSMASNVGNLLNQQGAALAGGQLAQGSVAGSGFNTLLGGAGLFAGVGGLPGISKLF